MCQNRCKYENYDGECMNRQVLNGGMCPIDRECMKEAITIRLQEIEDEINQLEAERNDLENELEELEG